VTGRLRIDCLRKAWDAEKPRVVRTRRPFQVYNNRSAKLSIKVTKHRTHKTPKEETLNRQHWFTSQSNLCWECGWEWHTDRCLYSFCGWWLLSCRWIADEPSRCEHVRSVRPYGAMFLLPEGETSLLGLSGDPVMMSFTSLSSACSAPINRVSYPYYSLLLFTSIYY
jgi:hypothetical protein